MAVAIDSAARDSHGNELELVTSAWYWALTPIPAMFWAVIAVNQQGCFALQYTYDLIDLDREEAGIIKEEYVKKLVESGEVSAIRVEDNDQIFYFTKLSPSEFAPQFKLFAQKWLVPI